MANKDSDIPGSISLGTHDFVKLYISPSDDESGTVELAAHYHDLAKKPTYNFEYAKNIAQGILENLVKIAEQNGFEVDTPIKHAAEDKRNPIQSYHGFVSLRGGPAEKLEMILKSSIKENATNVTVKGPDQDAPARRKSAFIERYLAGKPFGDHTVN